MDTKAARKRLHSLTVSHDQMEFTTDEQFILSDEFAGFASEVLDELNKATIERDAALKEAEEARSALTLMESHEIRMWRDRTYRATEKLNAALAELESTELGLRKTTDRYSEARAEVKKAYRKITLLEAEVGRLRAIRDAVKRWRESHGLSLQGTESARIALCKADDAYEADTPEVDHE